MRKARICVSDSSDPNSDMFVPLARYRALVMRAAHDPRFQSNVDVFRL